MKYKEYKDNYEYICKMNDLRECMVQDFVIAPFLKSILPKCDIIPVDIKVSSGSGKHDYGKYCGKGSNEKYWTPDLCIAQDWRWNNEEDGCPTRYSAVVEIKSVGDSSNYIVSNTKDRKGKSFRDKTLNYLKDIGNSSVKNEIEAHLSKNKPVLFTDGVTWYFFEKNEKALEESKAEMFELGIRIIDEKKFDHIKWNESEKRYNDLKEKIKALCES